VDAERDDSGPLAWSGSQEVRSKGARLAIYF
jgi:hypothetical protein